MVTFLEGASCHSVMDSKNLGNGGECRTLKTVAGGSRVIRNSGELYGEVCLDETHIGHLRSVLTQMSTAKV